MLQFKSIKFQQIPFSCSWEVQTFSKRTNQLMWKKMRLIVLFVLGW